MAQMPLWPVLALSLVLCVLMLRGGQIWSNDATVYLGQARAVVESNIDQYIADVAFGVQYTVKNNPVVVYGWGLPLILAPIYAAVGLHWMGFKVLMIAFLVAGGAVCHRVLARGGRRTEATGAVALLLLSPLMTGFTNQILSDLPFLFFFYLGLLLFRRWKDSGAGIGGGILLGLVVWYSYWVRPNGVLLLAPVGMLVLAAMIRRDWRGALRLSVPAVTSLVCAMAANAWLPTSRSDAFVIGSIGLDIVWENVRYYLWEGGEFYRRSMGRFLFWVSLVPAIIGLIDDRRKSWDLALVTFLTLGLYAVWPAVQGLRFLFPVLPIYGYYVFVGFARLARRRPALGWLSPLFLAVVLTHWTGVYLYEIPNRYWFSEEKVAPGSESPAALELWAFLRTTEPDAVIAFRRASAPYLYAERRTIGYKDDPPHAMADYVVWWKGEQALLVEGEPVFENEWFQVIRAND